MILDKRLFGEHVTLRLVKTQNRELSFRCIQHPQSDQYFYDIEPDRISRIMKLYTRR